MSTKKITKPCPECGTIFTSYKCQNRKTCSRTCKKEAHRKFMLDNPHITDAIRGNRAFAGRTHTEANKAKFSELAKQRVESGVVDVQAMAEKSRAFTRGPKNVNWKGGISKLSRTERQNASNTPEYKRWRVSVFERDNYTCQMCEQHGGVLHADHIERWADNEELRYAVDNGRTLCVACHYYITFKKKMKPGQRWCNFTARKTG